MLSFTHLSCPKQGSVLLGRGQKTMQKNTLAQQCGTGKDSTPHIIKVMIKLK